MAILKRQRDLRKRCIQPPNPQVTRIHTHSILTRSVNTVGPKQRFRPIVAFHWRKVE